MRSTALQECMKLRGNRSTVPSDVLWTVLAPPDTTDDMWRINWNLPWAVLSGDTPLVVCLLPRGRFSLWDNSDNPALGDMLLKIMACWYAFAFQPLNHSYSPPLLASSSCFFCVCSHAFETSGCGTNVPMKNLVNRKYHPCLLSFDTDHILPPSFPFFSTLFVCTALDIVCM
jgi:hypothetical protein